MSLSKPISFPSLVNTGENWCQYSFVAKGFAYGLRAENILNGTELCPITSSTDEEVIKQTARLATIYDDKKRILYSYLSTTQSATTMIHIQEVDPSDVALCWKNLTDHFESQSKASIKQMVSKLTTMQQTDYPSVTEFVHDVAHRLTALKRAIKEQKVELMEVLGCAVLVDGLSGDYTSIATHLLLSDSLKFDDLKLKVLEYGERLKFERLDDVADLTMGALALKVSHKSGSIPDSNGWLTEPAICTGCGKLTKHTEAICFQKHPHLRPNQGAAKSVRSSAGLSSEAMTLAEARRIVAMNDSAEGLHIGSAW
jgi:hypothetical protein